MNKNGKENSAIRMDGNNSQLEQLLFLKIVDRKTCWKAMQANFLYLF